MVFEKTIEQIRLRTIIEAILEKEKDGQLCPQTIEELNRIKEQI